MRAAQLCLCIALLGVSAAFADSKGPSTWLKDYMSPPKASAMTGYYEEVEKATMCFRTTNQCQKTAAAAGRAANTDSSFYELDSLACAECPEFQRHQYYKQYEDHTSFAVDNVGITLGKCSFQKPGEVVDNTHALIGKANFKWNGPFYGTCYLENSGEDHCELPEGCEGATLQVQGTAFYVENAVRVGAANGPITDTCDTATRRIEGATKDVPADKSAKIQYARDYYYDDATPSTVPVSAAWVYDGTFTVHGAHPLKYKTGRFQYSLFTGTETNATHADAVEYPRLGDNIYKLEFLADNKGHY